VNSHPCARIRTDDPLNSLLALRPDTMTDSTQASLFLDWLDKSSFKKTKKAFLKESKFDISSFSAPATNVRELIAKLSASKKKKKKDAESDSDSSDSDSSSDDDSSEAASPASNKRARSESNGDAQPPAKKRKIDDAPKSDDDNEDDDVKMDGAAKADSPDTDDAPNGDAKNNVYGADPSATDEAAPAPSGDKETGECIKWNHEKGFGFIKRDNGKGDLFAHVNECWIGGDGRSLKVGSKCEFEVVKGDKGDAASGVTAVGGGELEGGRQMKGTINKWLADREFGFVTPDDGSDDMIIFNRDAFNIGSAFGPGDRVEFDIKVKDDGRRQATYMTLEGGVCKLCNICGEYGHLSRVCPTVTGKPLPGSADQSTPGGAGGATGGSSEPKGFGPPPKREGPLPDPTEGKSTGTVVVWRHEKGFGFIQVDGREGKEGQIFCHANSVYAPKPWRNPKVGSKVEFDIVKGDKGENATEVHGYGGGDVECGRSTGVMMRWLADRGFGFIKPDDEEEELFCGDRDCWEASGGFTDGDRVEFDVKVKETSGKRLATYVTREGFECLMCPNCGGVGYRARDCPVCNGTAEGGEEGGEEEQQW